MGIGIQIIKNSGGNLVSGNLIAGFNAGVLSEGNNYFLENVVSNCFGALLLSKGHKYRFNTTLDCSVTYSGSGRALTVNND